MNERCRKLLDAIAPCKPNEPGANRKRRKVESAILTAPNTMTEDCLCYLAWCEQNNHDGILDVLHDIMENARQSPSFSPRLEGWRNKERNTIERHFYNIMAEARDGGELAELDEILNYELVCCDAEPAALKAKQTLLSAYEFFDIIEVRPGSNEGIYLHWFLQGRFRQEQARGEYRYIHIATIKTLNTDLSAYKTMGAAAGTLEYYAQKYVNNHLKLYTPDEELKHSSKISD